MNIAILLAGGVGNRLGAGIPKQYVEVLGKPLIVHSLEQYQKSKLIDAIEVVCAPQHEEQVWAWAKQYGISKLKWIAYGGESCQESTRNGIFNLEGKCSPDDILMLILTEKTFGLLADLISASGLAHCQRCLLKACLSPSLNPGMII